MRFQFVSFRSLLSFPVMAEEILTDSLPDLNELEIKIGRKTPESLLMWMKDVSSCEDAWTSPDRNAHGSALSLSDKLNNLKQEMRWLRCADVKILRQLLAVHEGIEAMRWLMEDRGPLTSRGSSLTGSLSSLVTVEENGPLVSPYRESSSPVLPHDFNETTSERDQRPPWTDCGNSSSLETLSSDSSKARLTNSSSSKFIATHSSHESPAGEQITLARSLVPAKDLSLENHGLAAARLQHVKSGAKTITRALKRSSKRRELKMDSASFIFNKEVDEKSRIQPIQENLSVSNSEIPRCNQRSSMEEAGLLGYDAQWHWVESQDDVTFL